MGKLSSGEVFYKKAMTKLETIIETVRNTNENRRDELELVKAVGNPNPIEHFFMDAEGRFMPGHIIH